MFVSPISLTRLPAATTGDGANSKVLAIQRRLVKLGFLAPADVTGRYDSATQKAVWRFRRACDDLPDRGGIDDAFRKELRDMVRAWETLDPRRVRHLGTQAERRAAERLDDRVADAAKGGLGPGARSELVAIIERHLEAAGFDIGKANGTWNLRTTAAVKAFQRAQGLPETGIVDTATWSWLRKSEFVATSATSPAQARGEKSRAALRTERLLKQLGYERVHVDGYLGGHAEEAIKDFQRKHDLAVTGRVNGRTLKAMERAANGIPERVQRFIDVAKDQRGAPYVFGAEGPNAFDCSGLIYWALKKAGVDVPRLTAAGYQDYFSSSRLERSKLKPGDLIFLWYPNDRGIPPGQASHIEIYLGRGLSMGTDNPSEGARIEPVDWRAFIGGARVPQLYRR